MTSLARIDARRAPLYLIDLGGPLSDDEYGALLGEILAIYHGPKRSAFVWDMSNQVSGGARRRERQATFIEEHRLLIKLSPSPHAERAGCASPHPGSPALNDGSPLRGNGGGPITRVYV